jgi:NAD-dependent DNA ligase
MKIVFTGFRDAELEQKIENNGGSVGNSVSGKTSLVLVLDLELKSSSKLDKAKKLKINIMTKSDFIKKYKL